MEKIIDGIINPIEYYKKDNIKILWILKEGNVDINDYNKKRNICEEFKNGEHIKNARSIATFRKIIYASYWIFNREMNWDEIPCSNDLECYNIVNNIAYININKYPAGNKSYDSELYKIYEKEKKDLLNQIENINPEVIIFGNTFKFFKKDLHIINWDIQNTEQKFSEENNYYIVKNKGLIISAYHPAYPRLNNFKYSNEIKEIYTNYLKSKL
ncbi:MAG TPA: hypothetical protein DD740_06645 [Chryseobacterium sp.]|nr:hypothetical protein [Chryseobacterium sp.]